MNTARSATGRSRRRRGAAPGQGGVLAVADRRRVAGRAVARPPCSRGRLLRDAVGDRGDLAAEAAERVADDLPGLARDRVRLGDEVAAAGDEVGALEAAAEQMPRARAGGDDASSSCRASRSWSCAAGSPCRLAPAHHLQLHVRRRVLRRDGSTRAQGRVEARLHAEALVGVRVDALAAGLRARIVLTPPPIGHCCPGSGRSAAATVGRLVLNPGHHPHVLRAVVRRAHAALSAAADGSVGATRRRGRPQATSDQRDEREQRPRRDRILVGAVGTSARGVDSTDSAPLTALYQVYISAPDGDRDYLPFCRVFRPTRSSAPAPSRRASRRLPLRP